MSCRNCQCNDCARSRRHEKFHRDLAAYAKQDAEGTRRLWNINDESGTISQSDIDAALKSRRQIDVSPMIAGFFAEGNYDLKSLQQISIMPDFLHEEDYYGLPALPAPKLTVKDLIDIWKGEKSYGLPKTPQDNYTCKLCGCDKLCTAMDKSCWKCGEPINPNK